MVGVMFTQIGEVKHEFRHKDIITYYRAKNIVWRKLQSNTETI